MEAFLGTIMPVGFNFAPVGWALCEGQLLPINNYQALFSLLGTTFGGDGRTTFALPDLRGRSMRGVGNGAGLDTVSWGEKSGGETRNISVAQLPSHTHTGTINATTTDATADEPADTVTFGTGQIIYSTGGADAKMRSDVLAVNNTGSGQALNVMNPFLGIYVCIALQGTFPSRN